MYSFVKKAKKQGAVFQSDKKTNRDSQISPKFIYGRKIGWSRWKNVQQKGMAKFEKWGWRCQNGNDYDDGESANVQPIFHILDSV